MIGRLVYPERTAIKRKCPSAPARVIEKYIHGRVLDIGCGYGADAGYFMSCGHVTDGYDPYYVPRTTSELYGKSYDALTCIYVLNVLLLPMRNSVIRLMLDLRSEETSRCYFAVRSQKEIDRYSSKWERYQDGFITPRKTFQKGYVPLELEIYLRKWFGIVNIINPDKHKFILAEAITTKWK